MITIRVNFIRSHIGERRNLLSCMQQGSFSDESDKSTVESRSNGPTSNGNLTPPDGSLFQNKLLPLDFFISTLKRLVS